MDEHINYDEQMRKIISGIEGGMPRLLLHCCCAPCTTSVYERLAQYFDITLFYYNPNTSPKEEYMLRLHELKRFANAKGIESFVEGKYDPSDYTFAILGHEHEGEGTERCSACYELRLRETAKHAAAHNFDFFTTTLTVSPMKNANLINELGAKVQEQFGVRFLFSDFKKRGGYARSVEMSAQYNLYRQDYCGCMKSKERGV